MLTFCAERWLSALLGEADLDVRDRAAAAVVTPFVDDRGVLRISLDDVAEKTNTSIDDVRRGHAAAEKEGYFDGLRATMPAM